MAKEKREYPQELEDYAREKNEFNEWVERAEEQKQAKIAHTLKMQKYDISEAGRTASKVEWLMRSDLNAVVEKYSGQLVSNKVLTDTVNKNIIRVLIKCYATDESPSAEINELITKAYDDFNIAAGTVTQEAINERKRYGKLFK